MRMILEARAWAHRVKLDGMTLWFAQKHSRTPWHAKVLGALAVAYALSPIDLVPDFVPLFGYLDEVILLPLLIKAAVRLLPLEVLQECRAKAQARMASAVSKPYSLAGAFFVIAIWLLAAVVCLLWLTRRGR